MSVLALVFGLAGGGFVLHSLSAGIIAGVLAAAIVFALLLDLIKVPLFRRLQIAPPPGQPPDHQARNYYRLKHVRGMTRPGQQAGRTERARGTLTRVVAAGSLSREACGSAQGSRFLSLVAGCLAAQGEDAGGAARARLHS